VRTPVRGAQSRGGGLPRLLADESGLQRGQLREIRAARVGRIVERRVADQIRAHRPAGTGGVVGFHPWPAGDPAVHRFGEADRPEFLPGLAGEPPVVPEAARGGDRAAAQAGEDVETAARRQEFAVEGRVAVARHPQFSEAGVVRHLAARAGPERERGTPGTRRGCRLGRGRRQGAFLDLDRFSEVEVVLHAADAGALRGAQGEAEFPGGAFPFQFDPDLHASEVRAQSPEDSGLAGAKGVPGEIGELAQHDHAVIHAEMIDGAGHGCLGPDGEVAPASRRAATRSEARSLGSRARLGIRLWA
jgi:hypothetical protein